MTGTPTTVRQLYVWDHARLWRSLFAASGSRTVASDTVVEVFAAALVRAPAGQDVTDLVWSSAFTIARDAERPDQEPDTPAVDERVDTVVGRLSTLGADDRMLFAWHRVAGWTPGELAPALRSSTRALRRRLDVVEQRARSAGALDHGDPAVLFELVPVLDSWDEIIAAAAHVPPREPRTRWWRR